MRSNRPEIVEMKLDGRVSRFVLGPLAGLDAAERETAIERTLELVTRGLATGPRAMP